MRCIKCGYLNTHPFGLTYENKICSGCVTHAEKDEIDWQQRKELLLEIVKKTKNKNKYYDCIVPIVGDAEDYFVVRTVLELGLNPLIVSVNSYFLNNIGWKNLHNLITIFDVDSVIYNPNIVNYKELVRDSLNKYGHMYLPYLMLHTAFPVRMAIDRDIPLVIWGGLQSIEQAGKFSHHDFVEMTAWSRIEHDTIGVDLNELIGTGSSINTNQLIQYEYPAIKKVGGIVKGIYLSNFFRWDPIAQNISTLVNGFVPEINYGSYDIFERAGSSVYYQIHDLLKINRLGYRKIQDHVSRDLRHNKFGVDVGSSLVEFYSQNKIYIKDFFDWLDVTESGYRWFVDNKLRTVKKLIAEDMSFNCNGLIYPDNLSEYRKNAEFPDKKFIKFAKGI